MASTIVVPALDIITEQAVVTAITAAQTDISAIQAGSTFQAQLKVTSGTGTEAANAVTVSKGAGVITTSSLNTAAAGTYVITVTNTLAAATDVVLVTNMGGTSTTGSAEIKAVAGAGSFVITLTNRHASAAFNGTFILGFLLVKTA